MFNSKSDPGDSQADVERKTLALNNLNKTAGKKKGEVAVDIRK